MEQPKLQDYGITPSQYEAYVYGGSFLVLVWSGFMYTVGTPLTVLWLVKPELLPSFTGLLGFVGLFLGTCSIPESFKYFRHWVLLRGDVKSRIKQYEEQVALHRIIEEEDRKGRENRLQVEREKRRKAVSFWRTLKDIDLEREAANLFRRMGYEVRTTPTSGDQGVDLFLRGDGQTIIVQCKGLKSKVSPTVVRDLYGTMLHFRADRAVLVCPTGFHRGVWAFVEGKPVTLVDAEALSVMADGKDIGHDIAKVGLQNRFW